MVSANANPTTCLISQTSCNQSRGQLWTYAHTRRVVMELIVHMFFFERCFSKLLNASRFGMVLGAWFAPVRLGQWWCVAAGVSWPRFTAWWTRGGGHAPPMTPSFPISSVPKLYVFVLWKSVGWEVLGFWLASHQHGVQEGFACGGSGGRALVRAVQASLSDAGSS